MVLTRRARRKRRRRGSCSPPRASISTSASPRCRPGDKTCNIAPRRGRLWLPVEKHWAAQRASLRGRTGLDKPRRSPNRGEEQVTIWRRSYDIPPPAMEPGGDYDPRQRPRYAGVTVRRTRASRTRSSAGFPIGRSGSPPRSSRGSGCSSPRTAIAAGAGQDLSNISDDEIVALEIPRAADRYELEEKLAAMTVFLRSVRIRHPGEGRDLRKQVAVALRGPALRRAGCTAWGAVRIP